MVNVPITADISGVQQGLDRLNDALNRAGQSARALRDIDLSHPEIKDFADDLQIVQTRFDRLVQQGRGEAAAAARQFRQSGNLFGQGGLLNGGVQQIYPNPTTAARVQAQLQGYLLGGTALGPQQTQFTAPPQGGGGGGAAASGVLAGAMGAAGGIMGPMLGMLGIGSLTMMAKTAFDLAQQQGVAVDTLMRRINESGTEFDRFRSAVSDATRGLGVTSIAFANVAQTFQRLSGETSPEAVIGQTRFAIGAARAFGTDEGTFAAGMGRAQFMGVDPKQFALMIGEAVVRGGQTGQAESVQAALLSGLDSLNRNLVQGGPINGAFNQLAALYTSINQGAVETNAPGLRGPGAMGALATIDRTIMAGGQAGVAGQLLQMAAFNRYGVYSPYEIGGRIEGGMFARVSDQRGAPTVLQAELEEINARYGQTAQSNPWLYRNVIERTLGLRAPVTAALQAMPQIGQNLEGLYRGQGGGLVNILSRAGITDLSAINPTAMQDLAAIGLGGQDVVAQYRERALKRDDLTDEQRNAITNAAPGDLRDTLLRVYAQAGQEKDDATKLRESMAQLKETFIKVGEGLIKVIQPLTDALLATENVLNALNDVVSGFGRWLGEKFGTNRVAGDVNTGAGLAADVINNGWDAALQNARRALHMGESAPLPSEEQRKRINDAVEKLQRPEFGGYSRAQAVAIAGQAQFEGGMNEHAVGDGGTSFGLFQIHDPKLRAYVEKAFGKNIQDLTFDEQLKIPALLMGEGGPLENVGRTFRATQGISEGSTVLTTQFERPADMAVKAPVRAQAAEAIGRGVPMFPLPPAAASPAATGGAAPVTVHIDPLTVNHQVNSVDAFQQTLPTFVIPATPNNAPLAIPPPSNTGSQVISRTPPPPPAAPPPAPPPPSNWWDKLRSLQFDPAAAG